MSANYWENITTGRMQRRRLLKAGAAFSVGAAALGLLGCSSDDSSDGDPPSDPGETPQPGGKYGIVFTSTANFNPFAAYQEGNSLSGVHVYDRLVSSRPDKRKYVLEAAESVEQAEPTRIVFKLKPGMVYQNVAPVNGRAVLADDVAASQMYARNLATAFDRSFQVNFLEGVETPDPQTVVLKLKRPSAYLFSSTQLGSITGQSIVPKEQLEKLETNKPIGSGPYYLDEHIFNTKYLFKRNPTYRGAKEGFPFIDEREAFAATDVVARETMFRAGQIHSWIAPLQIQDRLVRELGTDAVLETQPGYGPGPLHLNMTKDHPWKKDVRVRQALYRATNRQQILDLVYAGKGVLPAGAIPAGLTGYQPDAKDTAAYWKYDPAEAKKLLEAAGWDFNKEYEIIQNVDQIKLTLAEVWAQQMSQIGMKFRIASAPSAAWLGTRIGPRDYDLTLDPSPSDDTPGKAIRLHHSDQLSLLGGFGLMDPAIDAMIEKSESATDVEENIKLVKQIQIEVLKKYSSTMMIFTPDFSVFRSAKLRNFEVNPVHANMYRNDMWIKA